jgi:hypothetical protein
VNTQLAIVGTTPATFAIEGASKFQQPPMTVD